VRGGVVQLRCEVVVEVVVVVLLMRGMKMSDVKW
jgi:hypothetical protein